MQLRGLSLWPAICGLALVVVGDVALAGSGSVLTLPQAGVKARTGLRLDIDTRWVDGSGYRPVRVRISPLGAGVAPADRKLSITLQPRGWSSAGNAAATATIELPQGQRFAEQTISVPQSDNWNMVDVKVFEDGRLCKDLSEKYLGIPMRNYYNWSEASPAILVVDSDAPSYDFRNTARSLPRIRRRGQKEEPERLPDIRALAGRLPLSYWSGAVDQYTFDLSRSVDDTDLLRIVNDLPRIDIVPPDALPDRWIDYSSLDVIIMAFDDLDRLASSEPTRFSAMRAWLATGATLVVFDLGADFGRLAELERLIDTSPMKKPENNTPLGWHAPGKSQLTSQIKQLAPLENDANWYERNPNASEERRPPAPRPLAPFLWREVDQGRLVAFWDPNPFPGKIEHWAGVFNSLGGDSWMWYRRHGLSLHRENKDYWSLMIPGVGKAPVASFLLLISLFVVVIGPVNYYFLLRTGRLYLLLLTVPVGAVLVTIGLVFYAITTDGLGVRSRTRSFTEVDQREGRAVAWSRQSYYAGLAPSSGMSFPIDAAVYPVEHRPAGRTRRMDSSRRVIWTKRQRLAGGYLGTRATRQFVVVESRKTEIGLDVDEDSHPPRVTNRLGVRIERLVLSDSDGEYFETLNLPDGETVALVPVEPAAAKKVFDQLLGRNRPAYPKGFDPYQMEDFSDFFGQTYYYGSNSDDRLAAPSIVNSLPERRLREILGRNLEGLSPRSYLAHVEDSREVSRGFEELEREADFHLLYGSW